MSAGAQLQERSGVVWSGLSATQVDLVRRGGRQVVLGGPGTGKTRALVRWALHRSDDRGPGPVVLVPSRRAADRVRQAVEDRVEGARGDRVARTPHSLAWAVLREHALRTGARPPRLVTASERDEAIADLLAGHAHDGTTPAWPPHLDDRLRLTRAFRDELREMSARAVEHGVAPAELTDLGHRHRRPEWVAAAHVLTEAEQVAGLRGDEAHDPASIVAVAADLLAARDDNGLAGWLAEQVGHLGVDDAQDLTPAAWSFVREAADAVGDLLVVGDPDGATQTFRGAHPGLLERAADWLEDPAAPVHVTRLTRPVRPAVLLQRVQAAVGRELHGGRVPAWSPASPEAVTAGEGSVASGRVGLLVALDRADEAVVVAGELRQRRHREDDPVPWSQMAVLVRSVRGADELRRTLEGAGVPVRAPGVRAPLREEPVVGLLLSALDVAADPDRLDADVLERLCVGPLGGGDPVRWRRLVTHARAAARPQDGRAVSAAEAMVGVCAAVAAVLRGEVPVPSPAASFAGLPPAVVVSLVRVVDVLAVGARAVPDGVEDALWQLWDRLRLAERWRRTALRGGPDARRAHADLDAVMALFDAASAWVDRNPRGPVAGFVAHLRSRAVGDDRLGGDGPVEAVTVTTPAGAVGERWRVVVVAGVQDGVWPNPRLRGSLLGLTDLVDVLRAPSAPSSTALSSSGPERTAGAPEGVGGSVAGASRFAELRRQARRDVVLDELRLFHVAVSRAVDELVVTAADDATTRPSDLCRLVAGAVGPELVTSPSPSLRQPLPDLDLLVQGELDLGLPGGGGRTRAEAAASLGEGIGPGSTLVEVTAALRREVVSGPRTGAAARLLARLGAAGVRGAHPREWSWLPAPGPDPARQVADLGVSPSAVERFLRCPLQWYLTTSGGTLPRETAQGLGTLVHAALEQVPDADSQALRAVVEHGWGDLELGDGWVSAHQRSRVEQMISKLAVWAAEQRGVGTTVVGSEVPFSYQVDDITVRGTVDRVELTAEGGVRVVDLKTGRTAVTAAEAQDNPQLQLYQLAVASGALPEVEGRPAGGLLLFVGGAQKAATERTQPAPDDAALDEVRDRVREVGRGMRAGTFVARPSTACPRCPVRSSCPTTAEGRRTPPPGGVS